MFLVCIPTFNYEHELIFGMPLKRTKKNEKPEKSVVGPKVDLRLKETRTKTQLLTLDDDREVHDLDIEDDLTGRRYIHGRGISGQRGRSPVFVSMEKVIYFLRENNILTLVKKFSGKF